MELLEGLKEYTNLNNRNRVVYHTKDIPQEERLQKVSNDASQLLPLCKEDCEHTEDYQDKETAANAPGR